MQFIRNILAVLLLGMTVSFAARVEASGLRAMTVKQVGAFEERVIYLESYYRNQNIDIGLLFDLDPVAERGLEIIAVEVRADSSSNTAMLTLTANGRVQDRQPATFFTYLDPVERLRLGRNFTRLGLGVTDRLYISSVTLRVAKPF